MNKLIRFHLGFQETLKYVSECLNGVNELSRAVMSFVNFKKGSFFALFPKNTDLKRLHLFREGGILPQNPIQDMFILGKNLKGQIIPTIQNDVSKFICNQILSSKNLVCIIDDYNSSVDELNNDELFASYGSCINNEVYYRFNKKNVSVESIENCLQRSNTFWHSLCVITEADCSSIEKEITLIDIHEICMKIQLILIGAYDAEGYIFWEPDNDRRKLHDQITGQNYGYQEIVEEGYWLFNND